MEKHYMTPATFLIHVLICSLAIIAIWNTMQPGQIFSWLGAKVRRKVTPKQAKPLVACPVCMASTYGSLYYVAFMWTGLPLGPYLLHMLLFILAVSGLNKIIVWKIKP